MLLAMYKNVIFFIGLLLRCCVFNQDGWDKKWYHIVSIFKLLIARVTVYLVVNSHFESYVDDLTYFGLKVVSYLIFITLYNIFVTGF